MGWLLACWSPFGPRQHLCLYHFMQDQDSELWYFPRFQVCCFRGGGGKLREPDFSKQHECCSELSVLWQFSYSYSLKPFLTPLVHPEWFFLHTQLCNPPLSQCSIMTAGQFSCVLPRASTLSHSSLCPQPLVQGIVQLRSTITGCWMDGRQATRSSLSRWASEKALSWWFTSFPEPCGKEVAFTELRELLLPKEEDDEHIEILERHLGLTAVWLNHENGTLCWVRTLAAQHPTRDWNENHKLPLWLHPRPLDGRPLSYPSTSCSKQRWISCLASEIFLAMSQVEKQLASQAESGTS